MAGIDRRTGKVISNLASAFQGVEVTLTTRLSSRVMRREFGGGVAELLGRAVTAKLFVAWQQLVATAIDLWEPRFKVRRVTVSGSADQLRLGTAGLKIEADFRPRGQFGDDTVERVVTFDVNFNAGGVQVSS